MTDQIDNPEQGVVAPRDREVTEATEPNVKFVGKSSIADEKGKTSEVDTADDMVPRWRRSGSLEFKLPEGAVQKAGWNYDKAGDLIRAFPGEFKPVVDKGAKRR